MSASGHPSNWGKVRVVIKAAGQLKKGAAEGKSEDRLSARIERALKSIGLNENAGRSPESIGREYHVILAGPERGGKATLVSALCGQEIDALPKVLRGSGEEFKCHVKTSMRKGFPHTVTFWVTIGSSEWDKQEIRNQIHQIVKIHSPIFLLFCLNPASLIKNDEIRWLVESCIEENVFIALVLTNIYFHTRFNFTLEQLNGNLQECLVEENCLRAVKADPQQNFGSATTFYYQDGKSRPVALTAEVNSIDYNDRNSVKPACGVYELILAIMNSISDEHLEEMIHVVLNNRQFWTHIDSTFKDVWNEQFLNNFRTWYQCRS